MAEEGGGGGWATAPSHGAGGGNISFKNTSTELEGVNISFKHTSTELVGVNIPPPPHINLEGARRKGCVEIARNSINTSSTAQRGPLTCLEDRAMRSGGPGTSGSSAVLSGGPVGSSFYPKGLQGTSSGLKGPCRALKDRR